MTVPTAYPGGKAASGVYQTLINQIPRHATYIETHLGGGAILRLKRRAQRNIGIDVDSCVIANWQEMTGVEIVRNDAVAFLRDFPFHGDEFVYSDPPYIRDSRRSNRALYRHEYSTEQHEALLDQLTGLPCAVMVSGYANPLYENRLRDWRCLAFQVRTRSGAWATETAWMNYPEPTELHDYRYLGDDFRERERIRRRVGRWKARLDALPHRERNAVLDALLRA